MAQKKLINQAKNQKSRHEIVDNWAAGCEPERM